jgi:hypothetical protein
MDWKRDLVREDLFNSAHHMKPIIHVGYKTNDDGTFNTIVLKINYKDKEWILKEVYNGNTNLSEYVTLSSVEKKFINPKGAFNEAEHKLVELMREGTF